MIKFFVFGSNLAGRHGKGAALTAINHYGAIYGEGVGPQGLSYAIPTKNERIMTLPIEVIEDHVKNFITYATKNPDKNFYVTPIGTGLAGYSHEDIAPLFLGSPKNCEFSIHWKLFLGDQYRYYF